MAHAISLFDGTTTLSLVSSDYTDLEYAIQSPQPAVVRGAGNSGDFSLTPWEYNNVSESIQLLVKGINRTELQDNAHAIQLMLDKVQQRQNTGLGPKVYIQVQFDGESQVWRSEILSGRLLYSNAYHEIGFKQMYATFNFARRYYWEGLRAPLTITSSEDSGAETVDVYNDDDATVAATNYILITPSPITGVLPTPVELYIKNDDGVSVDWREFYITNWVTPTIDIPDPFLLGSESAAATFAWSTAVEEAAWRWTPTILTDARLTDLAGRYYRILVAFNAGATTGVFLRAVVEVSVGGSHNTQYTGGRVYYNGEGLIDLGPVPIPPGGYDVLGTDVALRIDVYKPDGGSSSMTLDFIQLTPAGDGLFQRVVQVDFPVPNGTGIVVDGIEGTTYFLDGTRHRAITRVRGLPILLVPGQSNNLRILYREQTGFVAGRRFEVSAFYRPRRLDV